jgi:hypothetical protein
MTAVPFYPDWDEDDELPERRASGMEGKRKRQLRRGRLRTTLAMLLALFPAAAHAQVAVDTLALERARILWLKPDVGLDSVSAPTPPAAPKREHRRTELQLRAPATASAIPTYSLVATTDPNPKRLISSAPRYLEKRNSDGSSCCTADTILARSWPKLQIGLQLRAPDWAHPKFNPVVVATGPEIEPGHACSLFVSHGQPATPS